MEYSVMLALPQLVTAPSPGSAREVSGYGSGSLRQAPLQVSLRQPYALPAIMPARTIPSP